MRRYNRRYRALDRPTDVLSFPWNAEAGAAASGEEKFFPRSAGFGRRGEYWGDILISTTTARRSARRQGHSLEQEVFGLLLHGVLHLVGYDHARDRGEMRRLEALLRQRLRLPPGAALKPRGKH